jgi:hypothetical protein
MNPLALQSLNHFLLCEVATGADVAELGGQPFGLRARRSHQSSPPWESFGGKALALGNPCASLINELYPQTRLGS